MADDSNEKDLKECYYIGDALETKVRMMPPLEAEYRPLYMQLEWSRRPFFWVAYLKRHSDVLTHFICAVHLLVSIIDVVYIFCGTVYITNFFTCTYDKEVLNDPTWKFTERLIRLLNRGTHGFIPFPYIFTFTEKYQRGAEGFCHSDMFLIPWCDLVNFVFNCYWVRLCVVRYNSMRTKNLATFEVVYLLDLFKILVEFPNPDSFRYDITSEDYDGVIKLGHLTLLSFGLYIEYLYICKHKGESEEIRSTCLLEICSEGQKDKDFCKTIVLIPDFKIQEVLDSDCDD